MAKLHKTGPCRPRGPEPIHGSFTRHVRAADVFAATGRPAWPRVS